MIWLRQSTAGQEVPLGYFLDSTDGNTEETALTIANTDIKIWKTGATTLANKNSGGATHISNGIYYIVLDATDTDTVGSMVIFVHVSGALTVRLECLVLPANVYDSLIAGTDTLQADVIQWLGSACATPTIAGVPETDITHLGGDAQSATDLKDFADTGYDPATGKIQGVVLTDTCTTNTDMRGTDNAALASVCTEARLAELDAANLPADVDAILTDTGTTLDTKLNDIQGATFDTATDSLEAIRDRGDAAWTTGAGGSDRLLMIDTTIATLASQTSFTLTEGSGDDDAYNNCTIVIENATTATQKAIGLISDYTGATKTITLKYDPAVFQMAVADKVYILAENALKTTVANRQLDVTSTGGAGIDWSNIKNQTAVVDLSATAIQLCDTTTTVTNEVTANMTKISGDATAADNAELAFNGTGYGFNGCTMPTVTTLTGHTPQTGDNYARLGAPAGASVSADIAAVKADTAAILTDTADMQPKLGVPAADISADIAAVKAETASILDDTGTTGVIVATNNDKSGFEKGVGVTAFSWLMVDDTDHVTPETGLATLLQTSGNSQISKDGGSFVDLANIASIIHRGNGIYQVDLTASEMNADSIVLVFKASGADQRTIYIKTSS